MAPLLWHQVFETIFIDLGFLYTVKMPNDCHSSSKFHDHIISSPVQVFKTSNSPL